MYFWDCASPLAALLVLTSWKATNDTNTVLQLYLFPTNVFSYDIMSTFSGKLRHWDAFVRLMYVEAVVHAPASQPVEGFGVFIGTCLLTGSILHDATGGGGGRERWGEKRGIGGGHDCGGFRGGFRCGGWRCSGMVAKERRFSIREKMDFSVK